MEDKKDNKIQNINDKSLTKSGFLSGNHIAFVFKKIERLSSALYLLTNLWNDLEPLKWSIRQKNLDLISEASRYHYEHLLSRSEVTNKLLGRVGEIISLLEIAFSAGLLSDMNLRVLREEYLYLTRILREKENTFITLPKDFFSDATLGDREVFPQALSLPHTMGAEDISKGHKGHIKDISTKMSFTKKQTVPKSRPSTSHNENNDRREAIIKLVKNMGEITIKDAVLVIKNCSEKTIQRELISMTESGVLKKTGERRWSRYSLV